jgi:hypothetical protein
MAVEIVMDRVRRDETTQQYLTSVSMASKQTNIPGCNAAATATRER